MAAVAQAMTRNRGRLCPVSGMEDPTEKKRGARIYNILKPYLRAIYKWPLEAGLRGSTLNPKSEEA